MKNSSHLVIGMGEIGRAIKTVLWETYEEVYATDQNPEIVYSLEPDKKFDVLHICFGHKDNEVGDYYKWVNEYQEKFLVPG